MEWCHCLQDVTLTPASMALYDQKSYVSPHFDYHDWRNAVVPLMIPLTLYDADANGIRWSKSHVAFPFDHPDLTNGMMPLMTLLASCDIDTSIIALYEQITYITHCLNHLELIKMVVLLKMVWAACDSDASEDSAKWLKQSYSISFQSSLTNKEAVLLMILSVSYDASTGITWPKKSCFIFFQSFWPSKHIGAIGNAIRVIWCLYWCQQHHISCAHWMNKVMPLMIPNECNGATDNTISIIKIYLGIV